MERPCRNRNVVLHTTACMSQIKKLCMVLSTLSFFLYVGSRLCTAGSWPRTAMSSSALDNSWHALISVFNCIHSWKCLRTESIVVSKGAVAGFCKETFDCAVLSCIFRSYRTWKLVCSFSIQFFGTALVLHRCLYRECTADASEGKWLEFRSSLSREKVLSASLMQRSSAGLATAKKSSGSAISV